MVQEQTVKLPGESQKKKYQTEAERWRALLLRDRQADGLFFYGVKSTSVYCRPNCAARPARRENVVFFETCAHAESAGFRACKRCRPAGASVQEREAEIVRQACALIRESDTNVSLQELAKKADLSSFYFQKVFKRVTGVTPRRFAIALREERARAALRTRGSVTGAIYDAGYNASSRFYERSTKMLGMKPREYSAGGVGTEIRFAIANSSLGLVLVAGTDRGICAVHFGDSHEELEQHLRTNFARATVLAGDTEFKHWVKEVIRSINEVESARNLPLDLRGTLFQQRVWLALREIPAGTTTTYSSLAEKLGAPQSVRAVARACATNSIAVVVPCHRVVRRDGNLAGYRWGLERKRRLLEKEGAK